MHMILLLAGCFLKGDECPTLDDVEPPDGGEIGIEESVVVTLTAEDETAELASVTPGRSEVNGQEVRWTPASPLTPGSKLRLTLTTCDGDEETELSYEVAQGDPVGGATALEGRGWALPMPGPFSALELPDLDLTVTGGRGASLEMSIVGSPCLALPDADFSEDPYFVIGPADAAIPVGGYDVGVTDFLLSGSFADGGDRIIGATLGFTFDMRILAVATPDFSADDLCAFMETFSYPCGACRDGSRYCVEIYEEGLTADELRGGPFCP